MIGKPHSPPNPTVYTSPWDAYSDPTAQIVPSSSLSPTSTNGLYLDALLTALSRYLNVSSEPETAVAESVESDEFRMYEFKVRGCTRAKAHDWTECPFAHPGEKARRRDPRRRPYSGTACAEFRKGTCRRGDACEFAHGVFESWLHPTRYRTQACKDGPGCTRRVCFFAHSPGQLRAASGPIDPVGGLAARLKSLQQSKVKSMPTGRVGLDFGPSIGEVGRAGFYSRPGTPTGSVFRAGGVGYPWAEDPSIENRLGIEEPVDSNAGGSGPDIGWVSELVK